MELAFGSLRVARIMLQPPIDCKAGVASINGRECRSWQKVSGHQTTIEMDPVDLAVGDVLRVEYTPEKVPE